VIYLFGVAWLMYSLNLGFIADVTTGVLPFLPGCAIKAAVAYMIGERLP
jgi:biotin transport system substrate-specific component